MPSKMAEFFQQLYFPYVSHFFVVRQANPKILLLLYLPPPLSYHTTIIVVVATVPPGKISTNIFCSGADIFLCQTNIRENEGKTTFREDRF